MHCTALYHAGSAVSLLTRSHAAVTGYVPRLCGIAAHQSPDSDQGGRMCLCWWPPIPASHGLTQGAAESTSSSWQRSTSVHTLAGLLTRPRCDWAGRNYSTNVRGTECRGRCHEGLSYRPTLRPCQGAVALIRGLSNWLLGTTTAYVSSIGLWGRQLISLPDVLCHPAPSC